jgi:hypothetical protein
MNSGGVALGGPHFCIQQRTVFEENISKRAPESIRMVDVLVRLVVQINAAALSTARIAPADDPARGVTQWRG